MTNADIIDGDFGFNFDTAVNTINTGQGSLRQFILNSNELENTNLGQNGLSPGIEHSIFMIPSPTDPFGRLADPNFSGGVATITLATSLGVVTDNGTHIVGSTQTTNIGNSNAGNVGTGGTVGIDAEPLGQFDLTEIAIDAGGGPNIGITLSGDTSDVVISNLTIYNAQTAILCTGLGGTGSNRILRQLFLGTLPDGADPTALRNTQFGLRLESPATISIEESYIGYNGFGGIIGEANQSVLTITRNEIIENGWNIRFR